MLASALHVSGWTRLHALATKTVSMMGTINCSAPVVSMTITVVVSVMRVAPPMYAAAPTTEYAVSETGSVMPKPLHAQGSDTHIKRRQGAEVRVTVRLVVGYQIIDQVGDRRSVMRRQCFALHYDGIRSLATARFVNASYIQITTGAHVAVMLSEYPYKYI
jgi:hypothetical protein